MNNQELITIQLIDKKIQVGEAIIKVWEEYTDEPMEYFTHEKFLRSLSIMHTLKNKKYENNFISTNRQ